jgi:hypothetical protein
VKKILQCGNLTGNARRVRDAAADLYNLIQEWNTQHLLGIQILNTVMSMKLSVLLVLHFYQVIFEDHDCCL